MNLLQKIAFIIRSNKDFKSEDSNYYSGFIQFVHTLNLQTTVDEDSKDEGEDSGFEDLNFENFGFSKVEPDEIIFSAGGDWQEPSMVTLRLNENDEIYVAKAENKYEDDYRIKFSEVMKEIQLPDVINQSGRKKYFFIQDENAHWYMIPVELRARWYELCQKCYEEDESACNALNNEFRQYSTGGGISNIEFYYEK